MRLAEFIRSNLEPILVEWEAFATTLLPNAAGLSSLALRDHAPEILAAVAADLDTTQTREAGAAKARGLAPTAADAPETAAQTHAVLRAHDGFDINQLVAEYRALRASVLRLWMDQGPLEDTAVGDIVRFNEAVDQAVAESVGHFHAQVERARDLLLGMLGHDMRSPLSTIVTTAGYLAELDAGPEVAQAAARLARSGSAMQSLLDDLVDFNRARLGVGLRMAVTDVDLAEAVGDEVDLLRGAHPRRRIELTAGGDCHARCDAHRIQQLVRNLVTNAIKYGLSSAPVRVAVLGDESAEVRIEISNSGPPIGPGTAAQLFEPLKRGITADERHDRASLGLGLFIVREIARAHGGRVAVRSDLGDTTFAIHLPRHAGA